MMVIPSPDICTGRSMVESAGSRSMARDIQKAFTAVVPHMYMAYAFPWLVQPIYVNLIPPSHFFGISPNQAELTSRNEEFLTFAPQSGGNFKP